MKFSLVAAFALLSSPSLSTDAFVPRSRHSGGAFFGLTSTTATVTEVATIPIAGMKPGTSGLRKKVEVWQGVEAGDKYYVENFIQSLLDTAAAKKGGIMPETCVNE
jgi:phosphoglucomutase